MGGQPFSVHAEGERVILTRAEGARQEIDLVPPPAVVPVGAEPRTELTVPVCPVGEVTDRSSEAVAAEEPAPGTSALDAGLQQLRAAFPEGGDA